jgi:hypothetical protein
MLLQAAQLVAAEMDFEINLIALELQFVGECGA